MSSSQCSYFYEKFKFIHIKFFLFTFITYLPNSLNVDFFYLIFYQHLNGLLIIKIIKSVYKSFKMFSLCSRLHCTQYQLTFTAQSRSTTSIPQVSLSLSHALLVAVRWYRTTSREYCEPSITRAEEKGLSDAIMTHTGKLGFFRLHFFLFFQTFLLYVF